MENVKTRIIIVFFATFLGVFFLLLDSIGAVGDFYSLVSFASVPFRLQLKNMTDKINKTVEVISNIGQLSSENDRLYEENLELKNKLVEFDKISAENQILKEQLGLAGFNKNLISARIIGLKLTNESTLEINVGQNHGVNKKDIVIYKNFLIGEVIQADENSSRVLLISSPSINIPVISMKTNTAGLIKGSVGKSLLMTNILVSENIEKGEVIITSGVKSNYPYGLIVGEIIDVKNDPASVTKEAIVEYQIELSNLGQVFVMKAQKVV